MKKGPQPIGLRVRFFAKVSKSDGCWLWTGQRDKRGYGRIRGEEYDGHRGKNMIAPRVSWTIHSGPIPAGMCVLHRCDNPPCVNPEHLFLGTIGDNNKDATRKGRNARGSRNGSAKLTPDQAIEIRRRVSSGERQNIVAVEMNISKQLVSCIVTRKLWRHVDEKENRP